MISLNNGILAVQIDDQAQLVHLENLRENTGNLIHTPAPIFRMILQTGENWEDVAYAQKAELSFVQRENEGVISVAALNTRMGRHEIGIEFTLRLDGEMLRFASRVDNRSDSTVVDFVYPCVGGIGEIKGQRPGLILPRWYGEYHTDIIGELRSSTARDGRYELTDTYPCHMCMQWMTLMGGGMSLYVGSHDERFHATTLRAACRTENAVVLELDKMAFIKPAQQWNGPETVVWLYRGSWQPGAECYRDWANSTWRRPVTPKKWMQDMTGYLLVINKQQYGDILWPYDQIPALYRLAKEFGFNALGLFGWYETGHDNNYPDLAVAEYMGGEEKLREGIRAVQKDGGHVTLYYQGHLIDVNSSFYTERGQAVEGKTRWNTPYYEQYNKFTNSDFLRFFTRKTFVTACPHSHEWQELMAKNADWIQSLGADGILYDQIGGIAPMPCFSTEHGHDSPSNSYSQGRLQLLSRIRQQVDSHPDFAFMTEIFTDVYAQFIDCIHGWNSHPDAKGCRRGIESSSRPRVIHTPGIVRHTFPDGLITARNFRPFIEPRTVNYCLCYGLRMEMELRTFADLTYIENDPHPEWRGYSRSVSLLMQKHSALLMNGTYHCDAELSELNPALHHGRFTAGGQECIVFWNDTATPLPIRLAGHSASRWETPDAEGAGVPETLAPDSVIVLFDR